MLISLIRTVILYIVLITAMRLLGKRQIGELEPSELAITILISELAAIPMQDADIPLLSGLIPIVVLFALGLLCSALGAASPRFRRLMYGKPSIIIRDGVLVQREMRRLRISVDELSEELRLCGVNELQSVRYGIVETNGQVSVILNPGDMPVTRQDMGVNAQTSDPLPCTLISNGKLVPGNLRLLGLTRADVMKILEKQKIQRISDVFYLSCDRTGKHRLIRMEK